jgi:hypothetical protein
MRTTLFALTLLLSGCATTSNDPMDLFGTNLQGRTLARAVEKAAAYPFGSQQNPVRASMPVGQRAYLARLRCSDNSAPTFSREGSFGIGPYGSIMDRYAVTCATGTPATASVYMDMYHDHVEAAAVPGFTIVPE